MPTISMFYGILRYHRLRFDLTVMYPQARINPYFFRNRGIIAMTAATPSYERIDLRTSPEIKELLVRAATTSGMSISAFLIGAAQERAKRVLAENETIVLSAHDWEAFFRVLDASDKPRPKLKAAAKRYTKRLTPAK